MKGLLKTSHDHEHRGQQTRGQNAEAPSSPAAHRRWGRCSTHLSLSGDLVLYKLNTKVPRGGEWDIESGRGLRQTEGPLAEVLANFDLSSRDINLV